MRSLIRLPLRSNVRRRTIGLTSALALVTAGLVLSGAAAQAKSTPAVSKLAQEATSQQNSIIQAALARMPGGVRVGPGEVEWNAGTNHEVIMIVPSGTAVPAISNNCPYSITTHWTCVYNATNFGGTQLEFQDAGYAQDLYAYGGSGWYTKSWVNNRHQKAYLWQHKTSPHGASFCMSAVATGANSSGTSWSHDEWIYLESSGNCP